MLLGGLGAPLGGSWQVLGGLGVTLGGSWAVLRRSWSVLGRPWGGLAAILDRLEATLGYEHVSIDVDVNFTSFLHALPHTRWDLGGVLGWS